MVRYPISKSELRNRISKVSPTWLARAEGAKKKFKANKKFIKKGSPNWSDIKPVYMKLQYSKCAYCETKIEGAISNDIEHYRPKNPVKKWKDHNLEFSIKQGALKGYYMLALGPWNYCTSCKYCNSTLKSNRFPIVGKPGNGSEDDIKLLDRKEKPLLLYPLGKQDTDPEKIITFNGIFPVPVRKSGHLFQRARATIRFFQLDVEREILIRQRYAIIKSLWRAFEDLSSNDASKRKDATLDIRDMISLKASHASCARAFVALFKSNQAEAQAVYQQAREYFS